MLIVFVVLDEINLPVLFSECKIVEDIYMCAQDISLPFGAFYCC